jgi:hypothetical protein
MLAVRPAGPVQGERGMASSSLEDRLQRVEADLDRLQPSLHERLVRVEQQLRASAVPAAAPAVGFAGALAAGTKRFVAWMGAELPKFLMAAVLLVFGWGIKDSVDLSIKQRQLDLSYAKEMQGLLQAMGKPDAEMTQLQSTAVVLASYGAPALPSLLSELTHGGLRADAAITGIRSLALTQPEPVCEALPRVLTNRGRQFDWQAQLKVVTVLGENDCAEAIAPLTGYRAAAAAAADGKPEAFQEVVKALPLSPAEDYPRLLAAIDRSLAQLRR